MRDAVAGEVLVDERLLEPDRFEDLRTRVGRDRRDAHLRHHLEDALARGLHVVLHGLAFGEAGQHTFATQVADRVEREVRVDRAGAEAEQQAEVVDLARFTGLDHEADARARLLAHEVVVHRARDEQRGDRRVLGVCVAVGEDDDVRAFGDRRRSPACARCRSPCAGPRRLRRPGSACTRRPGGSPRRAPSPSSM